MKTSSRITIFLLCLLLLLPLSGCSGDPVDLAAQASETLKEQRFIIHGNGRLEAPDRWYDGSCSEEAFARWYEEGYRIFEIDFNFTSDGDLACIHHWSPEFSEKIIADTPLSMEAFMNCKMFNLYTPMNLDSVAKKMQADPSLYVITDIKDDNVAGAKLIAERYPELRDQFIIQIYNYDQYDAVHAAGFKNILLTIYALPTYEMKIDGATIAAFAKEKQLFAITFPYVCLDWEDYLDELKKAGVPLLTHTVNEPKDQQRSFDLGISGIYADVPGPLPQNNQE